jgi:hypothetical protein
MATARCVTPEVVFEEVKGPSDMEKIKENSKQYGVDFL